jgi:hypothetical protein
VAAALAAFLSAPSAESAVKVTSFLHRPTVQLGERFIFEIRVAGGGSVSDFDFAHLAPLFDIRSIDRRYVRYYLRNGGPDALDEDEQSFFFRFIALHTGTHQIGSIPLKVDGTTYLTQSHPVTVVEPEESPYFKLTASISKQEAYRGEPIVFSVTWYSRASVRYYNFLFPILTHPDMRAGDYIDDSTNDTLNLPFRSGRVPVERGRTVIDDRQFNSITFRQHIIPEKAGYYQFPRGTVQLWRPRDDSSSGYSRRGVDYETVVLASESISLRVLDLPSKGRPAHFSGLVGEGFGVRAEASPLEVNVGDPIDLRIVLSGPSSLDATTLPPLENIPGFEDFAFLPQRARDRMEGSSKVFSRVIRARNDEVLEIPPVEVVFFNTKSEEYETARSQAIPLIVRPTRVLIEDDLEGDGAGGRSGIILSREKGINFNYEGEGLLEQETARTSLSLLRNPLLLIALVIPPGGFFALLLFNRSRAGKSRRVHTRMIKRSLRMLNRNTREYSRGGGHEIEMLRVWVDYLGQRLGYPPGALTYDDVRRSVVADRIDEDTLRLMRDLFERYEKHRFARTSPGSGEGESDGDIVDGLLRVTRNLEKAVDR